MEPVSEDSIKEVSWHDMPLFKKNTWLDAIFLCTVVYFVVCYIGGSIMYIGTMSEEEEMLAEKKKELKRKLGNASNVVKTAASSPLPVKKSPETGIYRNE